MQLFAIYTSQWHMQRLVKRTSQEFLYNLLTELDLTVSEKKLVQQSVVLYIYTD